MLMLWDVRRDWQESAVMPAADERDSMELKEVAWEPLQDSKMGFSSAIP